MVKFTFNNYRLSVGIMDTNLNCSCFEDLFGFIKHNAPYPCSIVFFFFGVFFFFYACFVKNPEAYFVASGSLFTASALAYTAYSFAANNKESNSKFYLEKIERYLQSAITLIEDGNNNNIKWANAIDLLIISINELSSKITAVSHKSIYIMECKNTAYKVIDILSDANKIHSFYFGAKDYNPLTQYIPSEHFGLGGTAISAHSLSFLVRFLVKISKLSQINSIDNINTTFNELSKPISQEILMPNEFVTNFLIKKNLVHLYTYIGIARTNICSD